MYPVLSNMPETKQKWQEYKALVQHTQFSFYLQS